jgi:hypothetical protein
MASDPQLRQIMRPCAAARTAECGSLRYGFLVPRTPLQAAALTEPQSAAWFAPKASSSWTFALSTAGSTHPHVPGAPSLASVVAGDRSWGQNENGGSRPSSLGWESEETQVTSARRDSVARSRCAGPLRSTLDSNVRVR